ncbi:FAD dependent oxidoreductase domain-containing protein [Cadophora sp. DSE1049]|nr:FAD dependent oxidoreductase domain-containing protein [Cadophora sp. DSE1049]
MPKPLIPLRITIVGAGIGGLAAATCLAQSGHQVQVLEAAQELSEIGAGIQINPNALRILDSMGLKDVFYKEGTKNEGAVLRRYKDGKLLGKHRANPLALYGYHNLTIHRADYQRILYDAALEAGADVRFGKKVVSVDISIPSLTIQDGPIVKSDLVVGADGIGSRIRSAMFPNIQPHPTPDCAFRIILTRHQMLSNPALSHLVLQPSSTVWFGPSRHIVAYTIRGTELFNVVCCGPGTADTGAWNEAADLDELKKEYAEYDDTVKALLEAASECHKWRISEVPDLPSWRNGNGRLVLLGDAAHAMMPYMAQGATQAIEDAAILTGCLSRAHSLKDIPRLTEAYEEIRKPRAEKIKAISLGNRKQYGLPDGPEQVARDEICGGAGA